MSSFDYKYFQSLSETEKKTLYTPDNSFWQSGIWADILSRTGQAEIIIGTSETTTVLIERRRIFWRFTGLYILGASSISQDLLESLKQKIVSSSDLFVQVEPISSTEVHGAQGERKAPFRRFLEPVTAVLDLRPSEDDLMASFAEKGRYNIRLAQKRGVTTRWVSSNTKYKIQNTKGEGKAYIEAFYELLEETTERDGFSHNSLNYYKNFVEALEANNAGGLLVAEKDGVIHAVGIFAYWGDMGIYYYGASSSDRDIRRDMATYLLQWEAICEAKRRKCSTYDFLGISEDGKGKLAGVTEFKLRFNPAKIHLPDEVAVVYKPVVLKILQVINWMRKLFR